MLYNFMLKKWFDAFINLDFHVELIEGNFCSVFLLMFFGGNSLYFTNFSDFIFPIRIFCVVMHIDLTIDM